jgi:hypothetical protein
MKKRFKILLIASLITSFVFTNNLSKAQSFQKGTFDIDLGLGFGFYATQVSTTINGLTVISNGHAGSWITPFSLEYGIGNRVGLGLEVVSDHYITQTDSISGTKPNDHSSEVAVIGNYHFVRTDHIDFYGGLSVGVSSITVDANNNAGGVFTSGGSFVDLHFNTRFFIGHHFAFTLSLRFPTLNYSNGTYSDNIGNSIPFSLTGSGWVFGIGIAVKI